MCGIGGQILFDKKKGFTKEQAINAVSLLISLQGRGQSAWGMYLEKRKDNNQLYCGIEDKTIPGELFKTQNSPSQFFEDGSVIYFLPDTHTFLVHTRAPTQGPATFNENNHPFNTKDFVLAHNGSVHNDAEIIREYNIKTKIECDSYVIVSLIQHFYDKGKTVEESIGEMSKIVDGSYACWLYHKPTRDLYLFRNTQPLSYYVDDKLDMITFASTEDNIISSYDSQASIRDDIKQVETYKIFKLTNRDLVNVGTIHSPPSVGSNIGSFVRNRRNNTPITPRSFDTEEVDKSSMAIQYMYDLLEQYENENHDQTMIVITQNGEISLTIRPPALLSLLDKGGFKEYKSLDTLYESDYWEYNFSNLTLFCEAVDKLRKAVDGVPSNTSKEVDVVKKDNSDENFNQSLEDLAEVTSCSVSITPTQIIFKYKKGDIVDVGVKRFYKKVGFLFRKDNTIRIRNSVHHNKEIKILLSKLDIYKEEIKSKDNPPADSQSTEESD